MNARQMKKCLKKTINKLQKDNDLMHDVIAGSPSMQESYDICTKPLNRVHTSMQFEKFAVKRTVDIRDIKYTKQLAARELLDGIKHNITYKVDTDGPVPTLIASIIVAYDSQKEGDE